MLCAVLKKSGCFLFLLPLATRERCRFLALNIAACGYLRNVIDRRRNIAGIGKGYRAGLCLYIMIHAPFVASWRY